MITPNLTPQNQFFNLGTGFGDKSTSLHANRDTLIRSGLKLPDTAVLGMNLTAEVLEWIRTNPDGGSYNPSQAVSEGIDRCLDKIGNPTYLAVRSDPFGDDSGTGLYDSELLRVASRAQILDAIVSVVRSHDSPEAVNFRKEANLGEGISVIFQPLIGSSLDSAQRDTGRMAFAPAWSLIIHVGGETEVVAVPGFGDPMNAELKYSQHALRNGMFMPTMTMSSRPLEGKVLLESGSLVQSEMPRDKCMNIFSSLTDIRERLTAIVEHLRPFGRQYLECAISWDGSIYALQYAKLSIPSIQIPEYASKENGWAVGASPIGAVHLEKADIIYAKGFAGVRATEAIRELSVEYGLQDRSTVLLVDDTSLRHLIKSPRELWGALRCVGAIVCLEDAREHQSSIECHLTGAIRVAGIGYCGIEKDAFWMPREVVVDDFRHGLTTLHFARKALNVIVQEGRIALWRPNQS